MDLSYARFARVTAPLIIIIIIIIISSRRRRRIGRRRTREEKEETVYRANSVKFISASH